MERISWDGTSYTSLRRGCPFQTFVENDDSDLPSATSITFRHDDVTTTLKRKKCYLHYLIQKYTGNPSTIQSQLPPPDLFTCATSILLREKYSNSPVLHLALLPSIQKHSNSKLPKCNSVISDSLKSSYSPSQTRAESKICGSWRTFDTLPDVGPLQEHR